MDLRTQLGNILIPQQLWLKREINTTTSIITTIRQRILEIMESMSKFMDLHQLINLSSLNHGEEPRKLIHLMDSRTHPSNGSINQHWLKRSTDTTITIKLKLKTLEIMVSMSKSMDSHQPINLSSHNPGEEQSRLTHQMDLRTHLSNGSINQLLYKRRRETSVTKESTNQSTDSHPTIHLSYLNHGEDNKNHFHQMVSRTHSSNGSINQDLHQQHLLLRKPISVTKRLLQMSTDSHQLIPVLCHNHIQERSMPSMVF